MSTTEMAGTFRRAAQLIRAGGLLQGDFVDGTAHCVIGALMTVRSKLADDANVISEARLLAAMVGKRSLADLVNWNDTDGRTAGEVIALLEQAAEKLEADL